MVVVVRGEARHRRLFPSGFRNRDSPPQHSSYSAPVLPDQKELRPLKRMYGGGGERILMEIVSVVGNGGGKWRRCQSRDMATSGHRVMILCYGCPLVVLFRGTHNATRCFMGSDNKIITIVELFSREQRKLQCRIKRWWISTRETIVVELQYIVGELFPLWK